MLIILAGITLNAVIGEGGIIFQARDTRNKISNETTYDNAQLAQLQNELKDNGLYSGIGIIPGTDNGGGSEGGENGTGSTNQGGSNTNTEGTNTNTGGDNQNQNATVRPGQNQNPGGGIIVDGKTDEDPKFYVVSGEEIAASFYQSDVTIQIFTNDRTKRIKYILTTTVDAITNELYPSGLVRELDIENGGTLTFTKDGEYTITAYAYDIAGNKSNPTIMWFKRQMEGSVTTGGVTVSIASGNLADTGWYTSNITLRVLGTNIGSSEVRYRIQGTATGTGQLGDIEVESPGIVDTKEVKIANGTTFRIVADGTYRITAYTYDAGGIRLSSSEVLNLQKDATRPTVKSYTGEQVLGSGFKVTISAEDSGAGLTTNAYTYRYRLAETNGEYISEVSGSYTKMYTGLNQQKTYDMYVIVTDDAGNIAISDVISRPSLWVNSGTEGEKTAEGGRNYYRSNVELTFRGQDSNNVDILKTTYQIIGIPAGVGSVDGTTVAVGIPLTANEVDLPNDRTTKTISLQADGEWTVKVRNYNKEGILVTTNIYAVTTDTVAPTITNFVAGANTVGGTMKLTTTNDDFGISGQATGGGYLYYTNDMLTAQNAFANYDISTEASGVYTFKVITKDKAGNTSEKALSPVTIYYLADKVAVGDYVAYDVGSWCSTVDPPTLNGTFGGYTANENKGTSIDSFGGMAKAPTSGWRVFTVNGSGASGVVTLVSAGTPVRGYFSSGLEACNQMKNAVTTFITDNFINSTYASAARNANSDGSNDGDYVKLNMSRLLINNSCYWLTDDTDNSDQLGYVATDGKKFQGSAVAVGLRPIVTLRSGVKTNNTNDTSFLSQACWAVK